MKGRVVLPYVYNAVVVHGYWLIEGFWFVVLVDQRVSQAFCLLVKRMDFYHALIIHVLSI